MHGHEGRRAQPVDAVLTRCVDLYRHAGVSNQRRGVRSSHVPGLIAACSADGAIASAGVVRVGSESAM